MQKQHGVDSIAELNAMCARRLTPTNLHRVIVHSQHVLYRSHYSGPCFRISTRARRTSTIRNKNWSSDALNILILIAKNAYVMASLHYVAAITHTY